MTNFRPKVYTPDLNGGFYENGDERKFRKFDLHTVTKRKKFEELTQVAPDIWIKDFSLTKEFCKNLITKFNMDNRVYAGVTGGGAGMQPSTNKSIKDSCDLKISSTVGGWDNEDEVLFKELSKHTQALTREFQDIRSDGSTYFDWDSAYQMQKTLPDGKYVWHTEVSPGQLNRSLTFMWYINDNYEGGNTGFVRQGVEVEAKTGRLVLFSPYWTHIHSGLPVTKGEKYIITGWMHTGNQ